MSFTSVRMVTLGALTTLVLAACGTGSGPGNVAADAGPPISPDCTVEDYEQDVVRKECLYATVVWDLTHDEFALTYVTFRVLAEPAVQSSGSYGIYVGGRDIGAGEFESETAEDPFAPTAVDSAGAGELEFETVEDYVRDANAMLEQAWDDGSLLDKHLSHLGLEDDEREQAYGLLTQDDFRMELRGDELIVRHAPPLARHEYMTELYVRTGDQTEFDITFAADDRRALGFEQGRVVIIMPGPIIESTGEVDGNIATWEIVREGELHVYAVSRP